MPSSYRKKMIEVALPLEAINKASAKEKSIRHGHPSTLHLWWARRPLAACRAVLFASLVDDPDSDPMFAGDEDIAANKRAELFNLIEDLVLWENSNNPRVINRARAEIARCVATQKIEEGVFKKDDMLTIKSPLPPGQGKGEGDAKARKIKVPVFEIRQLLAKPEQVNAFLAEYAPPVLDPFCGGGSIPLEAQRLGLRAYASDLNPVPVLINKALIEIPPKFAGLPPVNPDWRKTSASEKAATVWQGAQGLAKDVQYYGKWMRDEAEKRISHFYPKVKITKEMAKDRPDLKECVGQSLTVIAWLWGRTAASSNPAYQGVHVPLVSSFWLSKKPGRQAWLRPVIDRESKQYSFDVVFGTPSANDKTIVEAGTKLGRGCKFRCLLSDEPIPEEHIKREGQAGRLGSRLLAIVADGEKGRVYLPASVDAATPVPLPDSVASVDAPLADDPRNLWCLGYGLDRFDKLFTARQLLMLTTLSDLVCEARTKVVLDGEASNDATRLPASGESGLNGYADAVATYLGLGIDKLTDYNCTLVTWIFQRDQAGHAFSKQAIPMVWGYAEVNPFVGAAGDLSVSLKGIARLIEDSASDVGGHVFQLDATEALPKCQRPVVSTDPPYYDNIGYSDLSDFFYVWMRRSVGRIYPSLFSTVVTPKSQELIASPYRHGGDTGAARDFFEKGFGKAFTQLRQVQYDAVPMTVYYAFKQAEGEDGSDEEATGATAVSTGWETMLVGLVHAGLSIHGTWPMRTERSTRSVGMGTNALASSIVLVCRSGVPNAPMATRKEFITSLRAELPTALRNLQQGNIAPVDLAQAAIGPGMGVFTRYSKVMETDGSPMTIRTALGLINQALDEVLAEQEGEFDGDTRWALAWFEQFGMEEGPFGVAETLSKAKNTAINGLIEAGVVKSRAGKVQLLKRDELSDDWDPATDERLTVWEVTQHLIRIVEKKGESAAAVLLHQLGGMGEIARDLAYRLYTICERKKWADEALAYNGLVIAWSELSKLALSERTKPGTTQTKMFE